MALIWLFLDPNKTAATANPEKQRLKELIQFIHYCSC